MAEATFYHEMAGLLPGRVRQDEPLARHTTWRIGGPADIFVEPAGREELRLAVQFAHQRGIPLTVIGNGSNLLVAESGLRGIVLKIAGGLSHITVAENRILAEAGAKLAGLAAAAREAGLGGLEFSAGIPGTVGGAVVMNAGANGSSIGSLVQEVLLLSPDGEFYRRSQEELGFSYRSSILQRDLAIVVEASFLGRPRERSLIKEDMERFIARRKSTQPLSYPNAGSVFKNPPGDSAGRLIEAAGLKGLRIGGAQISTVHANFIINLGPATARDVLALITRARETVLERFGVELKLEVKYIGDD